MKKVLIKEAERVKEVRMFNLNDNCNKHEY